MGVTGFFGVRREQARSLCDSQGGVEKGSEQTLNWWALPKPDSSTFFSFSPMKECTRLHLLPRPSLWENKGQLLAARFPL